MKALEVLNAVLELERIRLEQLFNTQLLIAEASSYLVLVNPNNRSPVTGLLHSWIEIDILDHNRRDDCWHWWRHHDIDITDEDIDVLVTITRAPEAIRDIMAGEGLLNGEVKWYPPDCHPGGSRRIDRIWFLDFRDADWDNALRGELQ